MEETIKLANKMYYSEVIGHGVGKILGVNKSNDELDKKCV